MLPLVVLSRSLRLLPGDVTELSREHRLEVPLPSSGDAVATVLSSIAAAKHSRLELTVPYLRLLDEGVSVGAIAAQAKQLCLCNAPECVAARRDGDDESEPALRLAAVPRSERCAPLLLARMLLRWVLR
jgi:hypothetical protein